MHELDTPTKSNRATWRNDFYPLCVVQGLPRDKKALELDGFPTDRAPEVLQKKPCRWAERDMREFGPDELVKLGDGTEVPARALRAGNALMGRDGKPHKIHAVHCWTAEAEEKGPLDTSPDSDDVDKVVAHVDVHKCPGIGPEARSWVRLPRIQAIHAMFGHYLHPNMSMCRFRSSAAGEYACDLVFEIDAHAREVPVGCGKDFFWSYIKASLVVGRRIFDYLVAVLGIDPRYITTSISRMGCRVTIDWRCFGPRRLHEILGVIRFIESQVFNSGEIAEIAKEHGIPVLEIDTHAYDRADAPRPTPDDENTFIGPWLRPIGGLHQRSANAHWWYKVLPVEHDLFRAENVEYLTDITRGKEPHLVGRGVYVWKWPESRHPRADKLIEDNPSYADKLIEVFERGDLIELLSDAHKSEVTKARQKAVGGRIHRSGPAEVTEETIRAFFHASGAEYVEGPEKFVMYCVRPGCPRDGMKGAVYKDGGAYCCFRCVPKGTSLWAVASELGITSSLPGRPQSSSPVAWVPKDEAPKATSDEWNGPYVRLVEPECKTIEEVWAERDKLVREFHESQDDRVLVDISQTGLGKSETTRRFLRVLPSNYRIFAPRDDLKMEYAAALPDAVVINGRRFGENCKNEDLAEVTSRGEPVAKTLCSMCPHKKGCNYYADLEAAKDKPTILSHAHGPFAELDAFDNNSAVDVIDEDALDADAQGVEFASGEIELLRAAREIEDNGDEDASLDTPLKVHRVGATKRLDVLIDRLQHLLTHEAITAYSAKASSSGGITDLMLARHLFRDKQLAETLLALDHDDLAAHESARLDLLDLWRNRHRPLGFVVPNHVEKTWSAPASWTDEDRLWDYLEWQKTRLVSIMPKDMTKDEISALKRPKNFLPQLVEALRDLFEMSARGVSKVSPLLVYRPEDSGPWILRLTVRRSYLRDSSKIVFLSATTTPERQQLLLGAPTHDARWVVFRPKLPRTDQRTIIADRSYSKSMLLAMEGAPIRTRLFETTRKLIESERKRTGLPVAVLGPSAVMRLFLEEILGKKEAANHKMPFENDRVAQMAALKVALEPHGIIAGYAYGVCGSNEFYVEKDGVRRFVRSVIILGNPVPNLRKFSRSHRGLFSDFVKYALDEEGFGIGPRVVGTQMIPDWRESYRTVRFDGIEKEGKVLVSQNVVGFGDDVANSILAGRYQAELIQMAGRSRPFLPDPVDPTIQPRAYIFAGTAIPNWEVDSVVGLEDLRKDLGLAVEVKKTEA